eukprot:gene5022-3617_t
MSRAGATWRDGRARIHVVSGPMNYPNIEVDSDSNLDEWSRLSSPVEALPIAVQKDPQEVATVQKIEEGVEEPTVDEKVLASLWMEVFEGRYGVAREEERAYERCKSLEVEDYLRVHRTSRYFQKLKFDYFGTRMNTLCIHRLEQQYLKDDANSRLVKNAKEHKKSIKEAQEKAKECVKRLPPVKTAIGFLEPPEEPGLPTVITSNPPVLIESRRRRAADLELIRQVKLVPAWPRAHFWVLDPTFPCCFFSKVFGTVVAVFSMLLSISSFYNDATYLFATAPFPPFLLCICALLLPIQIH